MTQTKNPHVLETESIGKLLIQYSIPAIIAMTVTSVYNIVDSIFIGHGVGPLAISGLALTFPLMNLIIAFSTLIGVGGAAISSIYLGQKDDLKATEVLHNVLILCILTGICFGGITYYFLDEILIFFGASTSTLPYARDFMQVLLLGLPIGYTMLGLNNIMRATGYPKKAMLTALVSVLTGRRYGRLRSEFFAGCVDDNICGEKLYDYTSNDSSGKDIRLYGMRAALLQKERDFNENFCRRERTMNFGVAWMGLLSNFVTYVLQFGVYLLLIAAALRGGLSVGSIARYVSSVMLLLAGVSGLARTIRISVTNEEYMKRYLDYFDIPNPMYQGSLSVEKRDDDRYEVEFRDVSFRYPNTEAYALRHVSMKFRIGEKLAVVGRNGSGKTTFIKLLCRLYDPTEGEILLNGVDIRKYDYAEYQALFSVVFQDFRLFAFSLGQNVTAGADVDRARAEVCLREAGLGERLLRMPDGLDTMLYRDFDPHGVVISGGEAQKIAIARALYKNAPFLVLDEPTAALDPVSGSSMRSPAARRRSISATGWPRAASAMKFWCSRQAASSSTARMRRFCRKKTENMPASGTRRLSIMTILYRKRIS